MLAVELNNMEKEPKTIDFFIFEEKKTIDD